MAKIRRILVAVGTVDVRGGSALRKAAQLAKAAGARLELLHVLEPPLYGTAAVYRDSWQQVVQREKAVARRGLEAIATRWRQLEIEVGTQVDVGHPPHDAIVRRARRTGADLVVVECRRQHVLPGLLKPTDWELLRRCPVPVLLVRSSVGYIEPPILAAIDPTHARAKPSGLDEAIVGHAAQLARLLHGTLHVVHAHVGPAVPSPVAESMEAQPNLGDRMRAASTRAVERLVQSSATPDTRMHLVNGLPYTVIPVVARSTRAQIAVLGAVSRSALQRLFFGSTVERILDDLDCDVLTLKPGRTRTAVRRPQAAGRNLTDGKSTGTARATLT